MRAEQIKKRKFYAGQVWVDVPWGERAAQNEVYDMSDIPVNWKLAISDSTKLEREDTLEYYDSGKHLEENRLSFWDRYALMRINLGADKVSDSFEPKVTMLSELYSWWDTKVYPKFRGWDVA